MLLQRAACVSIAQLTLRHRGCFEHFQSSKSVVLRPLLWPSGASPSLAKAQRAQASASVPCSVRGNTHNCALCHATQGWCCNANYALAARAQVTSPIELRDQMPRRRGTEDGRCKQGRRGEGWGWVTVDRLTRPGPSDEGRTGNGLRGPRTGLGR